MIKKIYYHFLQILLTATTVFFAHPAYAQDKMLDRLHRIAEGLGIIPVDTTNPDDAQQRVGTLIGQIIGSALAFTGVIFIILIIYAGFLWMTARGNENQVEKAQSILKTSIIGIVIVGMAYALTRLIGTLISGAGLFQE